MALLQAPAHHWPHLVQEGLCQSKRGGSSVHADPRPYRLVLGSPGEVPIALEECFDFFTCHRANRTPASGHLAKKHSQLRVQDVIRYCGLVRPSIRAGRRRHPRRGPARLALAPPAPAPRRPRPLWADPSEEWGPSSARPGMHRRSPGLRSVGSGHQLHRLPDEPSRPWARSRSGRPWVARGWA